MRTLQRRLVRVAAACSLLPAMVLLIAATPYQQSEPRRSLSRDDLKVGQLLEIKAVRTGKDTIVASEIDVSDAKLEARIQEVDVANSSLLVLGVKVIAGPETKITNRDDVPIDFSTLQSGSNVVVKGRHQDDGTTKARQIILIKDKANSKVGLEGILQSKDQAQKKLDVLGITVAVTSDTRMLFEDFEPERLAGWDDLKVGQLLDLKGVRTGEDTIAASEIEVSGAKVEGPIEDIDVANSSLHLLGLKVVVSPETMIMDRNKEPIDLSTLQSGSNVVANGLLQNDGTVLAARIKAKKAKTNGQVIIEGILEGIDQNQNTLTVLGIAVSVTADTYIEFD